MRHFLSSSSAGACVGVAVLLTLGCSEATNDDDDSAPIGDDDDTTELPFAYLRYDFEATVDGDTAEVALAVVALDEDREVLCTYPIEFDATYARGAAQGGIFWPTIDGSLALVEALDPGTSDCGAEFGLPYHDTPADLIGGWSPLGFYGCDVASEDTSFLGDDPTTVGDGTFADYCNVTAPAVAEVIQDRDLGDVEAIWLQQGAEGQMDGLGDYAYLPGEDGETVWYVFGLLFAAQDNGHEPVEGMQGRYHAVPLWVFFKF